jgi:hypothetical protein
VTFGRLPKVLEGLAGPIRVDRPLVVDPAVPTCVGLWLAHERRILVRSTLKREAAWQIFCHEACHSWLDDAGVRLPSTKEEGACDAVAAGMLRLLRSLHVEPPAPPKLGRPPRTARPAKAP